MVYWSGLLYQITLRMNLVLDVRSDCREIMNYGSCYCYILEHMNEIVYGLDGARYVTILFHVSESHWKNIVRL